MNCGQVSHCLHVLMIFFKVVNVLSIGLGNLSWNFVCSSPPKGHEMRNWADSPITHWGIRPVWRNSMWAMSSIAEVGKHLETLRIHYLKCLPYFMHVFVLAHSQQHDCKKTVVGAFSVGQPFALCFKKTPRNLQNVLSSNVSQVRCISSVKWSFHSLSLSPMSSLK